MTIIEKSSDQIKRMNKIHDETGSVPDWWKGIITISAKALNDAEEELRELREWKSNQLKYEI